MTKVTVLDSTPGLHRAPPLPVETPTAQIVKAANKTVNTTDLQGRVITVRRISALSRMRLMALAGPELSKNEPWLGLAALASSVTAVNGDAVTCNSIREIEFTVERLDYDGLTAVADVYKEHFGVSAKEDAIGDAKLVRDSVFRECLALVKNGILFDVAFSMDESMRLACCIVFGKFDGNKWDWELLNWQSR